MMKEFPIIRKLGGRNVVRKALQAKGMTISARGMSHWATRGRIATEFMICVMEIADEKSTAYRAIDFRPTEVKQASIREAA